MNGEYTQLLPVPAVPAAGGAPPPGPGGGPAPGGGLPAEPSDSGDEGNDGVGENDQNLCCIYNNSIHFT